MYNRLKFLLSFLFIFSCNAVGLSQKKFSATIQFPSQLDKTHIQLLYDNGKKEIKVKSVFSNRQITISDSFYSKYATITINYLDKRGMYLNSKSFFVPDEPAQINFYLQNKKPLEKYKLKNAYDLDSMGAEKLKLFDSSESRDFEDFMSAHRDEFGTNDSLQIIAGEKGLKLWNKELEFITENRNLYYSFWLFRREIIPRLFTNADSLLEIYNSVFPDSFKQSTEGAEILKVLEGRIHTRKNQQAPAFTAIDTRGKTISLSEYHGKYVILSFWASWCSPCIEEIPALKRIRDSYSEDRLEIISITYDKDTMAFSRAVKKYNMNWIHIFGNEDLIKKYGDQAVPMVYLLDDTGKVIYSREEDKDFGEQKLLFLSKILKERL
ncbi:MAG TPA: TlpA disulfide reductase family protein [Hanamia sp.]|jgi:thiol-disulfide isomerase/thioredoxin|nr:TlpA disulfide reductase family protein [Hanamia sp.]